MKTKNKTKIEKNLIGERLMFASMNTFCFWHSNINQILAHTYIYAEHLFHSTNEIQNL